MTDISCCDMNRLLAVINKMQLYSLHCYKTLARQHTWSFNTSCSIIKLHTRTENNIQTNAKSQ